MKTPHINSCLILSLIFASQASFADIEAKDERVKEIRQQLRTISKFATKDHLQVGYLWSCVDYDARAGFTNPSNATFKVESISSDIFKMTATSFDRFSWDPKEGHLSARYGGVDYFRGVFFVNSIGDLIIEVSTEFEFTTGITKRNEQTRAFETQTVPWDKAIGDPTRTVRAYIHCSLNKPPNPRVVIISPLSQKEKY